MKTILLFQFDYDAGVVWDVAFALNKEILVLQGDHFANLCVAGDDNIPPWNIEGELRYLLDLYPTEQQDSYQVIADAISSYYNRGNPVRVVRAGIELHDRHSIAHEIENSYPKTIFIQIQHLASQFDCHAYVSIPEHEGLCVPDSFKPARGWTNSDNPVTSAWLSLNLK